jgi:hypothetical protein
MPPVERTLHRYARSFEHTGVYHRRRDVFVTEELLNRPDVIVGLQQMRFFRLKHISHMDVYGHATPCREAIEHVVREGRRVRKSVFSLVGSESDGEATIAQLLL